LGLFFYNLEILSSFDIWLQAYNDKLQIYNNNVIFFADFEVLMEYFELTSSLRVATPLCVCVRNSDSTHCILQKHNSC